MVFDQKTLNPQSIRPISGKEMVDYIADYLENIRERRVFPDVKPGYMREMLPDDPPVEGEPWDMIFKDIDRVIMPGVSPMALTQFWHSGRIPCF